MSGSAVLVVDRRNPSPECGNGVGPLPRFGAGVRGIDEVRGDGDRVRRQRDMAFPPAPDGEAPPCGGVSVARPLGARLHRFGDSLGHRVRADSRGGVDIGSSCELRPWGFRSVHSDLLCTALRARQVVLIRATLANPSDHAEWTPRVHTSARETADDPEPPLFQLESESVCVAAKR